MDRREFLKSLVALTGAAVLRLPETKKQSVKTENWKEFGKKTIEKYVSGFIPRGDLIVGNQPAWVDIIEGATTTTSSGPVSCCHNGEWYDLVCHSTNDLKWTECLEYNV